MATFYSDTGSFDILEVTQNLTAALGLTGSLYGTSSWASKAVTASYALTSPPNFIDNFVTVGLPGSNTNYTSIKSALDSITDASENNTYTVKVYPGVYIEDTITMKSYIAVKGDSSISTVVSASNASASVFVMADQSMVIDMQIQGSTAPNVSAIFYSSPTTPQTNAIAYAENIRFGTNYTNATCAGSGSGNCILQCSNVKYGGFTDASLKSFDIGFRVTGSGGSIGRMQLRNVTSTNGGVAGTDNNQIFALSDAPGCTFIVNGCLLTRATGTARGTGFKVYNGGQLRLTAVNFQRWINGIWAPQTGSAPSIDAIALNFENCTTDVLIEHTGSIGKIQGTDTFLKTQIALDAPLYEVGQDPRRLTVAKKGGDFTSISASVAYITDSSENNRYIIEVGPGQFTENTIDLTGKPYVAIIGSTIQTTQIVASGSGNFDQILLGPTNEISFLSINGVNAAGYAAIKVDGTGDAFAQAHKVSIYDFDYGIKVFSSVSSSTFYGEYIDINGAFSYGTYVSSSNTSASVASMENYYLFPSGGVSIGNYAIGLGTEIDLYTCLFVGDNVSGSTSIYLADGAVAEVAGFDAQDWDYGVRVPNIGTPPTFRMVGAMIHDSITSDFFIEKTGTIGRFQGISDHTKINNVSEEFYWNFLDDTVGDNDVTRKLSVTFADGTRTDATTLIFKGSPMGVMSGGNIAISSSLTVTVGTGFGYLEDSIIPDVYKRIDWNDTDIVLAADTNNYLYFNDNGILSASGTSPNNQQNIILGRVVTNGTTVQFIDQSPYDGAHMSNKISQFNREALGPVFAEGSIVTEDITPFVLDVTQGNYYFSENNFLPTGTSSINLNQYYLSGSEWGIFTSSIVPANVYTSGSQLVAMSASYYTKHTVYLVGDGVDEEYFLVINNNQYATLVETENANLPTIPFYFDDGVVSLAAVYVQSGSANITQIQDIRPVIGFRAAGVNASAVHGNLLGLNADDHTQYLLVDGARQMSNDLGLGGNDLYNFGIVSGSNVLVTNVTASNANITSITGSLLGNASTATSSSYSLNTTSASFSVSSSVAVSSSYALTSSFAVNTTPKERVLTFVVGDSTTITPGEKVKTRIIVPYGGTITRWSLMSDVSTSTVVDIWKSTTIPTNSDSIAGSAKPTLTAQIFAFSSTLTGWTTTVNTNDIFVIEVESNSAASYINLMLTII